MEIYREGHLDGVGIEVVRLLEVLERIVFTMATKYEIESRNIRMDDVADAVREKITAPWWGTPTELVAALGVQLAARSLSTTLSTLRENGWLDHTVRRWHTGRARMIALIPPGWVWDNAARCWIVDGVPVPAQDPSQAVSQ